jgi:thioredoxin-dependent peroxiredoxin
VGVSADTQAVQQRFIDAFGLTFPLIADPDKRVIDSYGARQVLGVAARRSTFLVGPDGRIAYVWPQVTVEGHADAVVGRIRELQSRPTTEDAVT